VYCGVFKGKRMMSTQIHPAPLGTYFVAIFPLSIALFLKEKNRLLRSFAIFYIAIIFIGINLTFSRGAFLGAFVSILIMVIFLSKRKKEIFVLLSILIFAMIILISSSSYLSGYFSFWRYSFGGLTLKIYYLRKIERFIMMLRMIKEHPFFGVGFGHFRVFFDSYTTNLASVYSYDGKIADCMHITFLAETGLLGFGSFLIFVISLLKKVSISLKLTSSYEDKLFLLCFLSGFSAILAIFLTYDVLYWIAPSYLFWSYAGILSSFGRTKY